MFLPSGSIFQTKLAVWSDYQETGFGLLMNVIVQVESFAVTGVRAKVPAIKPHGWLRAHSLLTESIEDVQQNSAFEGYQQYSRHLHVKRHHKVPVSIHVPYTSFVPALAMIWCKGHTHTKWCLSWIWLNCKQISVPGSQIGSYRKIICTYIHIYMHLIYMYVGM